MKSRESKNDFRNISLLIKINKIFITVFNLVLLIPVYYIGVGISNLFWKFSRKNIKNNKNSYWINSVKLSNSHKDYRKRY